MFTQEEITPYLDNYASVTKRATDKFVCPLTLEKCELNQITRGHIVPQAVNYEFNRTVPVSPEIDHFYGTRVEAPFVDYLRAPTLTLSQLVKSSHQFQVRFSESGPAFDAFVVHDHDAFQTQKYRAVFPLTIDGEQVFIGLKGAKKDDPRLPPPDSVGKIELSFLKRFLPLHCVASMLKIAYLTMFEMIGYRAVFDPSADCLRRVLTRYFYNRALREEAPEYFRQFDQAVRIIGMGTGFGPEDYRSIGFDTLRDRKVLCHFHRKRHFAATLVYNIAGMTFCVIVPQTTDKVDIALATRLYDRLISDDNDIDEEVFVTTFNGSGWVLEAQVQPHYQPRLQPGQLLISAEKASQG